MCCREAIVVIYSPPGAVVGSAENSKNAGKIGAELARMT